MIQSIRISFLDSSFAQLMCVCTILLFTAGPLSAAQLETSIRQHFEAAHQAQLAGDLATAAREYRQVLHLQPDIPEVYANLGLVYYAENKFLESARAFDRADALKPGLRGVSLYLGIDDVKLGFADKAVPHLERAIKLEPKSKEANTWLATALWDTGKTSAALAQLRATSKIFPSDIDSLFLLSEGYRKAGDQEVQKILAKTVGTPFSDQVYGDIYAQQKSWIKAATHYRHAIQIDPSSSAAYFGLGVVSLRQNKLEDARKYFLHELQIDASSSSARARLAEIDFLENRPKEGLTLLNDAIRTAPGDAVSALDIHPCLMTMNEHYGDAMQAEVQRSVPALESAPASAGRDLGLTVVEARLGHHEESSKDWASFNRVGWPKAKANFGYHDRAVWEFDREQYNEAALELDKWLTMHPDDLRSRYLLSMTYNILSRKVVEHMLSLDPNSVRIHQMVAKSYENSGEDNKALDEYKVVEEMDPTLPGVHFAMGNLLWKNEESDKAVAELQKELRLNPDHAEANAELGTILVSQHDPDKAIPYLVKALKLAPDLTLIHQQLGEAYYMDKQYSAAQKELTKAIAYDKDGAAHYLLGSVYRSEGKNEKAKEEFEIARRMKSEKIKAEVTTTDRLDLSK